MTDYTDSNKIISPPVPDWSRLSFLLVEDNQDHQWLLSAVLRDTRVKVAAVQCGEDAVDLVRAALGRNEPYDLILMDIRLPTIDGYETTRRMRAAGYEGPIVAITARAMKEEVEACHGAGCDACVSKPFDRVVLRETLTGLLARTVLQD